MKNKTYFLNTMLAAVTFVGLLAAVLTRTFVPAVVLPQLSIPNLVAVSLVALLLDHYIAPGAKRCYICIPVFAALTFGLLPWAAGFIGLNQVWVYALAGGVVFTATTWLFTSMADRISTGPSAKLAPIMSALGLYLASQCFMGMF
jgi:hypothetical protein